mgnify:CR=1 FL=1
MSLQPASASTPAATDTAAGISVRPLAPAIGAEILGVDLSRPLDEAAFAQVHRAWLDHCVILFRDQDISEEDQVRFAARFGPPAKIINKHTGKGTHENVMFISNIRKDGQLIGALPDGEMYFHSDQCYVETPCMAALLYAIEIPSRGGDTSFANTYRAYEALPEEVKAKIEGRKALNVYDYANAATARSSNLSPDAPRFAHPIVRTHPETGRKALYVNRLMTTEIVDMPADESAALLEQLFRVQEREEFTYRHVWRPGDLLMWDNRCTLHARSDFDASERRLLRRVTVLGERPR